MMPLIIVCQSCGFILYNGREPVSVYDVLKKWGFRCPCCLSELKPIIQDYKIEPVEDTKPQPE